MKTLTRSLHEVIKNALHDEDQKPDPNDPAIIDMFMFKVLFRPGSDVDEFVTYVNEMLVDDADAKEGPGVFRQESKARLREGPSYIELGAWVGDQQEALMLMALGQHHGYWDVITPMTLHMERDSEDARQFAGMGGVMIGGFDAEKWPVARG